MNIALNASTLSLGRDGVVAVRDGRGTRVRCLTGALWITEDHCTSDTILLPGDTATLRQPGLTLIMALEQSTLRLSEPEVGSLHRLRTWIARRVPSLGHRIAAGC